VIQMIDMYNTTKVLLPAWIFEQAEGDKDEIRRLTLKYMQRYPDYRVLKIQGKFAICERER